MRFTCIGLDVGGGGVAFGAQQAGFDLKAFGLCSWADYTIFQSAMTAAELLGATIDECRADVVVAALTGNHPEGLSKMVRIAQPSAVIIAATPGALLRNPARDKLLSQLLKMGFRPQSREYDARELGMAVQRRVRFIVALKPQLFAKFDWPRASTDPASTVASAISDLMGEGNWRGLNQWRLVANCAAPEVMLRQPHRDGIPNWEQKQLEVWAAIGIDGTGIAGAPPEQNFEGQPRLTARMLLRLHGYPDTFPVPRTKADLLDLIRNDSPPPMVAAVAAKIRQALVECNSANEVDVDVGAPAASPKVDA